MPDSLKPLLTVLSGGKAERKPIWLMRQAGRYLPEYRVLRAEKGGFLALATDPEAAAEITLQPIRRFGFDAAILFSDILVVPHALGRDLRFEDEGDWTASGDLLRLRSAQGGERVYLRQDDGSLQARGVDGAILPALADDVLLPTRLDDGE